MAPIRVGEHLLRYWMDTQFSVLKDSHVNSVKIQQHKRSAWSETAGGSSPSPIWSGQFTVWLVILSVNRQSWGATWTYHWTFLCLYFYQHVLDKRSIISDCNQWISIGLLHFDWRLLCNKTTSELLFGHFWKHYFGSEHLMLCFHRAAGILKFPRCRTNKGNIRLHVNKNSPWWLIMTSTPMMMELMMKASGGRTFKVPRVHK